jgi:hypothetical protein
MTGTKKRHSAAFKARVALEAAKQTRTLAESSGDTIGNYYSQYLWASPWCQRHG